MAEELSVVGRSVPLVDAPAKVTGAAKYTGDIKLEGMLHGRIAKSLYAHAKIVSIDTGRAEALPGVKLILTYKNVPPVRYVSNPQAVGIADMCVLEDEVRFVGDEVALVVAESEEIAEEAMKLLDINYKILPAVFDPEEAVKPEAPRARSERESNILSNPVIETGDVDKGFAEADLVVEDTFKVQRISPVPLQTHSCVASWDKSGKLTVWDTTQIPFRARKTLSQVFNMPLNKIRVISGYIGGAFGSKNDVSRYVFLAALASKKLRRPVKAVYTREDEFLLSPTRHPMVFHMKIGVRNDGIITAMQVKAIVDTGNIASVGPPQTALLPYLGFLKVYTCPNFKYEGYCVYTNYLNSGSCRGWGAPEAQFALESILSIAAEKLNIDPIEFRLRNHLRDPGEVPSLSLQECLRKGKENAGWHEKWQGYGKPTAVHGSKRRGIGMAITKHAPPIVPPLLPVAALGLSSAIVRVNEDGSVQFLTGTVDLGTGSNTSQAQIVAEVLGVPLEKVAVTGADTETTPFDLGSYGSRTLCAGGFSAAQAAVDAKHKLFEAAAPILGMSPEELSLGDGRIFVRGKPEKSVSIAEVATKSVIIGQASGTVPAEPSALQAYGAQFVEVEVDTETGQVEVLKVVAAHDVGKAINPEVVEGQIIGCIKQGAGYALTEEFVRDRKTGATLNSRYSDYEVYSWHEMPEVDSIIVEMTDPNRLTPYGSRCTGEPPLTIPHAAIINAINDAIGIRFKELPITPDKVLKALGKI